MSTDTIELPQQPKILIVLLGALGDIARGIVVLELIKERYPDSSLTWLVEKKWKPFLELHPKVDQIITFEKKKAFQSLRSLRKYFKTHSFDVTLDMQRHAKSGFLTLLSGSKYRIGFHRKNSKEGNWLLQTDTISEVSDKTLKVYHYKEFAKKIGCAATKDHMPFGLPVETLKSRAREVFDISLHNCISFVLGSSWPSKDWSAEGYTRLAKKILTDTDFEILLLGDKSQVKTADDIASNLPHERVHSLTGETDLPTLTAVMASTRCNLGPDSGPAHISAALGVPYVTLFGPTDPDRVAAYGPRNKIVRSNLSCMPCKKRTCPGMQHLCMELLSVDDIANTVYRIGHTETVTELKA